MKNRNTNLLLLLSCLLYVASAFSFSHTHTAAAVRHRLGRDDEDVSSHFRSDPSDRRAALAAASAKTAFPAAEDQRNLRLRDSSTGHFHHAVVDDHQQRDRYGYVVDRNDNDIAVEQHHQSRHRTSRAHYRLWSKLPSSKSSKSKSSKNDKSTKSSKAYPAPATAAYSSPSKSAKSKSSKASAIAIAVAEPTKPTTITASEPSQTTITTIPSYSAEAKATDGSPDDAISSFYSKSTKAKSTKPITIPAASKSNKTTTVASKSAKAKASNDESPDGAISSDSKSVKAKSSKTTSTSTPKSSKTLVFTKTAKSTKSSNTLIFGSKSTKAKTKASSSERPISNDDSDGVRLDFEGPSEMPSNLTSSQPSSQPSSWPSGSEQSSERPSIQPHATPSNPPSQTRSSLPSSQPSRTPTVHPSTQPSIQPGPAPAPLTLEQREAVIATKCAGHSVVSRSLALLTLVGGELVSDPEGSLIRQEGPLYDAYVWLAHFDDGILCPPPPPAAGGDKYANATLSSSTSPSLSPSNADVPIVRAERVERILQRYALAATYYALNGDGWTNCSAERKWLGDDDDDDDDGAPDDATDAVDAEEVGPCLAQGDGRNGVRFLDTSHECNWFGLSCGDDPDDDAPAIDSDSSSPGTALSNDLDGYRPITEISLPRNNLRGTIPIEFYKVFGGLSTLNITDGNGVDGLMTTRGGDGMGAAEEAEIFA